MRFLNSSYSLYKKMLLYTLVLVAGVILLQSFVLNRYFERIGAKITFDANLNILSQISYSANYMNDAARSFAATIYSDPKNLPLMYGGTVIAEDVYSRMRDIDTMVNQSPYIYSVYLYNGTRREFYSTVWDTIAGADQFHDRDMAERIESAQFAEPYAFAPIPRQIPLNSYRGAGQLHTGVFTYIVYERFYGSDRIQNAIVVNVKVDYLAGVINALKTKGAADTKRVLIATGDRFLTGIVPGGDPGAGEDEALLREMNRSSGKSGYFRHPSGSHGDLVTFVTSDILDWKFVSLTPYEQIMQNMDKIRLVAYVACLAVALLGFVLTYLLTRHLYSPIRYMIGRVGKAAEAKPVGKEISDIAFLSKAFEDGIESTRKLRIAHNEKSIREKQQALLQLLTDERAEPPAIGQAFAKWNVALHASRPAFVCSFAFDREAEFQAKYGVQDQKLFCYMVGNVAGEMMSEAFEHEFVVTDSQRMVLILQRRQQRPAEDGEHTALAARLAERVQTWFFERTGLSLTAAIGYEVPALSLIASSYGHAAELSKYRLLYGHRSVLTPDCLDSARSAGFERPVALEKQLGESLAAGKLEETLRHYRAIVDYIVRYSYDHVASYLLYLSYFIYMKANETEARGYEKPDLDFGRFTGEIMACETLEQVGDKFAAVFAAMTEIVSSRKFKRKNALAEKIVRLLETRYSDPALCQEGVAGELNVSRDYVGRIFKETYGRTFAECLNEIRLKRAALALASTNKSIAEITEEIGWENKNYFYTMFKARFGMTTSEYRTKHGP